MIVRNRLTVTVLCEQYAIKLKFQKLFLKRLSESISA